MNGFTNFYITQQLSDNPRERMVYSERPEDVPTGSKPLPNPMRNENVALEVFADRAARFPEKNLRLHRLECRDVTPELVRCQG